MSEAFDIVVVGGGIVGSAIGYAISADPDFAGRIAVIERDPTYAFASTAFATGVIRPQFSTPANIRMSLASYAFLAEAGERLETSLGKPDIGLRAHGYMILVNTAATERFARSQAAQLQEGADTILLTPADVASAFPLINTDGIAGAYLTRSGAGSLDPWALLQAFKRKAIELGASYFQDEAKGFEIESRRITRVRLASGASIACGLVINAGGARDAQRLAAWTGASLPVEPRVRTTFNVACTTDLSAMPMFILPNGLWVRPEKKGFLCGLTPSPDKDQPTEEFRVDHDQFEAEIWPSLAEISPAFEALKVVSAYCGHYDFNALDENAILGRAPPCENFIVATGFSGHGVMHSPATGMIIADLALRGRYERIDASVFDYQRVAANAPVKELNVF